MTADAAPIVSALSSSRLMSMRRFSVARGSDSSSTACRIFGIMALTARACEHIAQEHASGAL